MTAPPGGHDGWEARLAKRRCNLTLLAHVNDVGLYGSFSPDGGLMAYESQSGLFVGHADATGFVQVDDPAGILTVDWVR